MKFKATLIAFLFSINLLSEDQLYVVDLILIKYLPEFETNEIFSKPIVNFPDNMTFLREFPYPELEINSVPFDVINISPTFNTVALTPCFENVSFGLI